MSQREVSRCLTRERLTSIEARLGWGGSDKWPVDEPIRLWACAAENILDERDDLHSRLEMIAKICKSTKHLNPIADILKECDSLRAVLLRIQTHQGLDINNCSMKPYEILCECQEWAENVLKTASAANVGDERRPTTA